MLPNPLHPAVVHFPVVLAVLLPIFAAGALWTIRRGTAARKAWAVPMSLALALAVSSWIAVQTGEAQDERVESVVAEQPLEAHEKAAEAFLTFSAGLAALTVAGLIGGRLGRAARVLATIGAVALVGAAARVGHSGGELVYRHGAASAYASPASGGTARTAMATDIRQRVAPNESRRRRERDD
jgi:uncharacterized membrane protein